MSAAMSLCTGEGSKLFALFTPFSSTSTKLSSQTEIPSWPASASAAEKDDEVAFHLGHAIAGMEDRCAVHGCSKVHYDSVPSKEQSSVMRPWKTCRNPGTGAQTATDVFTPSLHASHSWSSNLAHERSSLLPETDDCSMMSESHIFK